MDFKRLDEGMQIFKKYLTEEEMNDPCTIAAEHDIVWFVDDKEEITEKDRERLDDLGFFIDEEHGCWAFWT